jgi:hypothetical protein
MNRGWSASGHLPRSLGPPFVLPLFWKKSFAIAEEFIVVRTPGCAVTSADRRKGWSSDGTTLHRTR